MRQEDQSVPFHQKTPDLCKVHKNRQNSVDSITDICFHVGMDAREMKKRILASVLYKHNLRFRKMAMDDRMETMRYQIADNLDMPLEKVTDKTMGRYNKTLRKMVENAESKLD